MQKSLILNATPIIYLCKIGWSKIFTEFSEEKYTAEEYAKLIKELE